eukprot:11585157-Alexandrium_andersonii.AAC.1
MVVERFGEWPRQLRAILAALIPKGTKGYRTIGVMVSLYRVWAKMKREQTRGWERQFRAPPSR